jgi:hypothetical protein
MAIVLCISPNSWCSFLVRTTARGSAIDRSIATDHRSPCDPSPCPSALQEKSASCLPALRSLRRPRRSSRNLVLWAVVDAIQPATAGPVCPGGHPAALGTFSARLCVPSRIPNGIRTDASALKRGVRYQPPQGLLGKHHVGEECACGWRVNPDVACLGEALHVSVGSLSAQSVSGASDDPRPENG